VSTEAILFIHKNLNTSEIIWYVRSIRADVLLSQTGKLAGKPECQLLWF
jgi:hypothetical protein